MAEKLEFYKFSFENLEVWQKSIDFAILVYKMTKSFPKEEVYGLSSQIQRASVSISSNIAEGSSKKSFKEQARFSEISFGSLMEVLSQLILAKDLEYITEKTYSEMRKSIEEISRLLNAYKNSQIKRGKNE